MAKRLYQRGELQQALQLQADEPIQTLKILIEIEDFTAAKQLNIDIV
jgi:hypothetical protein